MSKKIILTISGLFFFFSSIINFSIFFQNFSIANIFYIILYCLPPLLISIILIFKIKNVANINNIDITLAFPYILFIVLFIISKIKNKYFSLIFFDFSYFMHHILFIVAVILGQNLYKEKNNVFYYLSACTILVQIIYCLFNNFYFTEIFSYFTEMLGIILYGIYVNNESKNNNQTFFNKTNINVVNNTNNDVEKLLKYKNLLDKKIISEDDFKELKSKIFYKNNK